MLIGIILTKNLSISSLNTLALMASLCWQKVQKGKEGPSINYTTRVDTNQILLVTPGHLYQGESRCLTALKGWDLYHKG